MEITTADRKTCTVVHVGGSLDRTTAPQLEQTLRELSEKQGINRIVVDLSGVPDMSSAGLRVLISTLKRLRGSKGGGDLRLAVPGKRVSDVLELAGLLPVIRIFDSEEEAVESFAGMSSSE